jgi:hypothetical protein
VPRKRIIAAALGVAAAIGLPVWSHAQLLQLPDIQLPGISPSTMPKYTFQGPIEAKYARTGPWATSLVETTEACDREGSPCAIFYPSKLGYNAMTGQYGFKHPVISIAGGTTTGTPENPRPLADVAPYDQYLRHLASWGFVVVLTRDGWTSTGETVADAAEYMVAKDAQAGSRFRGKLDTANMGMMGFSQGGGTAAALLASQNPLFKTYISGQGVGQLFGAVLSAYLPDNPMSTGILSLANVTHGSIFYVGSTTDFPVSGLDSNLTYYLTTSNRIHKVMGVLNSYPHPTVLGNPGCNSPETCEPNPYRGLGVAWMLWKLRGVEEAGSIFRQNGEFARFDLGNPDWGMKLSNVQ